MKLINNITLIACILITSFILPKASPDRVKGWLQLDTMQEAIQAQIAKNTNIDAQLKNETNEILEENINTANQLGKDDPTAAYALYHEMKKLTKKTAESSVNIAQINKKFKDLSDYIDQQIKELATIRRKHLQFPS